VELPSTLDTKRKEHFSPLSQQKPYSHTNSKRERSLVTAQLKFLLFPSVLFFWPHQ